MPASWWATSGRKPEETPSIGQVREPRKGTVERPRQWNRNDTPRPALGCGNAEVGSVGMKRPSRGMQGQITADERLPEVGGSPLSSMSPKTEDGLRPAHRLSQGGKMGKKWGRYKAGGRSQPVSCVYCGRRTPRIKAVIVRKHYGIGSLKNIPGLDRRRVFLPQMKAYACISCAKHRRMI